MITRPLALFAALLLTVLSLSTAGLAAGAPDLDFTLRQSSSDGKVQLGLTGGDGASSRGDHFSSSYYVRDLAGLSPVALAGPTPASLRFALDAAAGRLDCAGTGHRGAAAGRCGFAPYPAFSALLARHGYAPPSRDDGVLLTLTRFDPAVLDALDSAGVRRGDTRSLAALAIFRIDAASVRAVGEAGFRPASIGDLVMFKIHGVTPAAIRAYRALGYDRLSASQLVQMRIFGVTPEFVRSALARGGERPAPDQLVKLRMFGIPRR